MRFTKIKFDGKKIILNWEVIKVGEPDKFSLESLDEPRPEFNQVLQSLKSDVLDICQLPDDYIGGIEIRSVSFSYGGENEIPGATITALKTLTTANAPLCLNTPHLPYEDYSGNNPDAYTLSRICIERLNNLCKEAELYVNGDRKQQSLFPAA